MDNILPNDPLFSQQWYLNNVGQSGGTIGEDINVLDAWETVTGEGVVIGIVDGAVQFSHPDLASQDLTSLSKDFAEGDSVPNFNSDEIQERVAALRALNQEIIEGLRNGEDVSDLQSDSSESVSSLFDDFSGRPTDIHGTPVAGIAVASNNAVGTVGVAYDAQFAGLRIQVEDNEADLDIDLLDAQFADALSHRNDDIDIYNNSWEITPLSSLEETNKAIATSATEGRNGLGNIYIFAGGNDGLNGGNVNYSSLTNSRHTIAVGAIDHNGVRSGYSNPGASLLVSAYANADNLQGLLTTDLIDEDGFSESSDYTNFPGTSAAAPLVSGVVALMLEANSELTARDVQHILVESAVVNDPDNLDWRENGAGYLVNHNYGFGTVDAEAAVTLAQDWENVGEEVSKSSTATIERNIPDNNFNGISSAIEIDESFDLEWVEVVTDVDLIKDDLTLILTSPDGTRSVLSTDNVNTNATGNWTFTSARHWGESSAGEWSLKVIDNQESEETIKWDSWQLKLYGTDEDENENRGIIASNNSSVQSQIESARENIDNRVFEAFGEVLANVETNTVTNSGSSSTSTTDNATNNLLEQFQSIFASFDAVGAASSSNLGGNSSNVPGAANALGAVGSNSNTVNALFNTFPGSGGENGNIGFNPEPPTAPRLPTANLESLNDIVSSIQGSIANSGATDTNDSNADSSAVSDSIRDRIIKNQANLSQTTQNIIESIRVDVSSSDTSNLAADTTNPVNELDFNSLFVSGNFLVVPNIETNTSVRAIVDDAPIVEIESTVEFDSLDLSEGEGIQLEGTLYLDISSVTTRTLSIDTFNPDSVVDIDDFDFSEYLDISEDVEIINVNSEELNRSSVEGEVYSIVNEEENFQLYTTEKDEVNRIGSSSGYSDEGIAFITPESDDISGSTPVYHLSNPQTGENIYTISEAEREDAESSDYDFEDISFYAYEEKGEDRVPLYDVFNEDLNTHFYTLSRSERDDLDDLPGYKLQGDGIAFYVEAAPEI